jgi:hypothetical protein
MNNLTVRFKYEEKAGRLLAESCSMHSLLGLPDFRELRVKASSGVGFSGVCHTSDELSMLSKPPASKRITLGELMVKAVGSVGVFGTAGRH